MQGSLGGPEEQQREMGGQDLQSMLEEMRDEREGDMDSIKQYTIFPKRLFKNEKVIFVFSSRKCILAFFFFLQVFLTSLMNDVFRW